MSGTRTCLVSDEIKKIGDNQWLITVQENAEDDELFIQLPEEAIELMGWKEDDVLEWNENKDGSWTIQKK